jgi:thiosulfate reductase cytochrome b subunit
MAEGPRHSLATRLWHWLNAACLFVLFFSGLNISNAHPWLYWGAAGFAPAEAWLALPRFPAWMTIPGFYSLADARLWHFLAAWPFALGFALFLIALLLSRHRRDFALKREDLTWRALRDDLGRHLKLDFAAHGGAFNLSQKYLYIVVLFVLLPLMILTGLTLSPAIDSAWPWLVDLFGGRQSARSIHFIVAWALLAFFVLHLLAVLLSGPVGQVRDMIVGGRAPA